MIIFLCVLFFCCFLQAEDGRRDLVRSRGLGDVYKRQIQDTLFFKGIVTRYGDKKCEPEKGKAAVVLGALRAHQMSNSLEIKGTSLSKYEYLYRRDLSSPKQIFKPLIDMNKGDDKTLKGLRPRDLRILGRKIIGDQDEQPVILFTIPGPNCTADESTYSLKLKFINKTISYRWIEEREGGYEEKEYKEIYNES